MKNSNKKMLIILSILVIGIIGFAMNKKDIEVDGALISSHWLSYDDENSYGVMIDEESDYSKEEIESLKSLVIKSKKEYMDVSKSKNLGTPSHSIMIYTNDTGDRNKSFNLWLYEDKGYIQFVEEGESSNSVFDNFEKISKLENDEHDFLVKALLKYYSEDKIFIK